MPQKTNKYFEHFHFVNKEISAFRLSLLVERLVRFNRVGCLVAVFYVAEQEGALEKHVINVVYLNVLLLIIHLLLFSFSFQCFLGVLGYNVC